MIGRTNVTVALAFGLALAAAAPAQARSGTAHRGYDARAQVIGADQAIGAGEVSELRAEVLRECNAIGNKAVQYTWGDTQSDLIRACMAQHGQGE
jgi:hypothetical protein